MTWKRNVSRIRTDIHNEEKINAVFIYENYCLISFPFAVPLKEPRHEFTRRLSPTMR